MKSKLSDYKENGGLLGIMDMGYDIVGYLNLMSNRDVFTNLSFPTPESIEEYKNGYWGWYDKRVMTRNTDYPEIKR